MRYLIIFMLLGSQTSFAQQFFYPTLAKQTKNLENITPENWKIIDTASGDLNADSKDDLVMVLEYNLPISEHRAYGDNETEIIKEFQRPRILVVYFKDSKSNKFVFVMQNNNFILRANEGGEAGEPLRKIKIENNSLKLAFEGGGFWRWKLNYHFQYQNKMWIMVKANNTSYNPTSGEFTDKTYNFAERKTKATRGNMFARNSVNEVSEETLYFTSFKTFTTFKKPWTWEISKDNYL